MKHKIHSPVFTQHSALSTQYSVLSTLFSFLLAFLVFLSFALPVASAEEDILVEKNLFSPERKKWIMEDPKEKKPEAETVKKEIADITLFGTVIAGSERYAVLRTKKKGKPGEGESKTPYAVGDYISGFLVKEIEPKRVVLHDPSEDKEYQLFINDESKDRTVEKTEIKMPPPSADNETSTPTRRKGRVPPPPKPVDNVDQLKAKVQRSIDILKTNKSDLVRKQAERDLQKLEQMAMGMSENDLQDLVRLKQELEKIK